MKINISISTAEVNVILGLDVNSRRIIVEAFTWIAFGIACPLLSLFGMVTNIINIACFIKQGFKDRINISLLGMAVSDFGGLAVVIWTDVCLCPPMRHADLPFDPADVQYITSGMLYRAFNRVTAWITAFITFERCLCIAAPFKVNQILTKTRVSYIIIAIFIVLFISQTPIYVVNRLDWKYFPGRNKTLIGLISSSDYVILEKVSSIINNSVLSFCSFAIVIVCTVTISVQLYLQSKLTILCTNATHSSNQNKRVAKLVVLISGIFIACFIPVCLVFITMSLYPEFSVTGKYRDISFMFGGIGLMLENINATVNIFVYYHMSTKYRETFNAFFDNMRI